MSSEESQTETLHATCEVCGGSIDTARPGYFKSPSEQFRHRLCHENGEPPEGYVWEWDHSDPKTCMNRQYNCGHVVYGPPAEMPQFCPECNDLVYEGGEWNVE